MFRDFLSLVFPPVCLACSAVLHKGEQKICTSCLHSLPQTNFHLAADNPVARLFWGRVEVKKATAFYLFGKASKVQKLIHGLKYKGQKEIGLILGKQFAHSLKEQNWTKEVDVIVPVPLHPYRFKKRGYNQSSCFAKGLGEVLAIPILEDSIICIKDTGSQSYRSRYWRWKSATAKFLVQQSDQLRGKNILLVDDVVTSGSTMEACARELLKTPGTTVNVATIAYTNLR